jgi:hypothetical protein
MTVHQMQIALIMLDHTAANVILAFPAMVKLAQKVGE